MGTKNTDSINKIKQYSYIVEYIYLAFISILVIKRYCPDGMDFTLYSPLLLDMLIALIYSVVIFIFSGDKEPSKIEMILRYVYLVIAAELMIETNNPTVQIVIILPTIIMAVRYSSKYTYLTAFVTTVVVIVAQVRHGYDQYDYNFIFIVFIWMIGFLINASMQTERRMQEEQLVLQEREKYAAMGQMAAGIAHEVRNPLTTIKSFIELMYMYDNNNEKIDIKKYLGIMDKEIDRVNELLKQFLLFARPSKPELTVCNLNNIFRDIEKIIQVHCRNNEIETKLQLNSIMPQVLCDYNQIKQVILNISLNAIDAMKYAEYKLLTIKTNYDYHHAFIQIIDTGIGIEQKKLKNIFNPFYTTKEDGTGLGLSICYSIMENHQGRIDVSSEPRKGTTFTIILPLVKD